MLLPLLLLACASTPEPPPGATSPQVVRLTTTDGVELVADHWPASSPARPAVVLLHMTPRGPYTRKDWPVPFIEALHARDWAVLALDRRGAGASQGLADEAFLGPGGRLDVAAAVTHLAPSGPLGLIGASNGTTSMIDYADWAPTQGYPQVAAMGFLSPGDYTENQTPLAEVAVIPSIFAYPESERAWPESKRPLDPGTWAFHEFPGSAHGTFLFAEQETLPATLEGFLAQRLDP